MKKLSFAILIIALATGCNRRPYQEEKYIDINPNETAFVIPLEQGTKGDQKQLKSIEYLEQKKVATKRIYTPTMWHQTGRYENDGEWIPSVVVIKVDRSPVTRGSTPISGRRAPAGRFGSLSAACR